MHARKPEQRTKVGLFSVVLLAVLVSCPIAIVKADAGLSAGFGLGAFIAQNKDRYFDIPIDVYPELSIYLDGSGLRLGLTVGMVYRKHEERFWDWYSGYEYHHKYTMMLVPVQAELALLPLKFAKSQSIIQPFMALGVGAFIPTAQSDYESTLFAASLRLGGEIWLVDYVILYGDVRYLYAEDDFGGFTVIAGGRLRIPFTGPRK